MRDDEKALDAEKMKNMRRLMKEGGQHRVEQRYGSGAAGTREFAAVSKQRAQAAAKSRERVRQQMSESRAAKAQKPAAGTSSKKPATARERVRQAETERSKQSSTLSR